MGFSVPLSNFKSKLKSSSSSIYGQQTVNRKSMRHVQLGQLEQAEEEEEKANSILSTGKGDGGRLLCVAKTQVDLRFSPSLEESKT